MCAESDKESEQEDSVFIGARRRDQQALEA